MSATDALLYEQFDSSIKATYRHKYKQRSPRKDELVFDLVFDLDVMQTNAPWEASIGRNNFSKSNFNYNALRLEKGRSNFGKIVVVHQV